MQTIKIFTQDAYLQDCTAKIVEILNIPEQFLSEGETGENRILVLNQTVFYAMSGGQPGDTGILTYKKDSPLFKTLRSAEKDGISGDVGVSATEESLRVERVIDTRYKSDEKLVIYHYLEAPTHLRVGDKVTCSIDWERRYKHMLQHSLIHIVGLVFTEMYGDHKCIGSNMGEKGRIDYEFFEPIDLEAITCRVQKLIEEDHQIATIQDPEDPTGVRMIWKMDPLEDMPCGGTHPKSSAEVGTFHRKRKGLSSQGQRIYCMLSH
jgi:Ser-tRNA(Ala) deacylase AlaX